VPVPADASALDALVAALGRNPVSGTTTPEPCFFNYLLDFYI
jgi:hypothetical protein